MKIIISPAKSLDFEAEAPVKETTQPQFLAQAERLNKILRKKSTRSLGKLMSISPALAQLNYERNQNWHLPFNSENAKPAVFAFTGEVYRGLDVKTLPAEDLPQLQDKLRILSGQYGILKPIDLIQPYRLEMGTSLKVGVKPNLYQFWGKKITEYLNSELEDGELFLNLASKEYFKVIQPKDLKVPVITPVFKDLKNGEYKIIMTFAKLARGLMVRSIIDPKVETLEGLKGVDYNGYGYDENLTTETELVFTR